jgi:hypothetical protein
LYYFLYFLDFSYIFLIFTKGKKRCYAHLCYCGEEDVSGCWMGNSVKNKTRVLETMALELVNEGRVAYLAEDISKKVFFFFFFYFFFFYIIF